MRIHEYQSRYEKEMKDWNTVFLITAVALIILLAYLFMYSDAELQKERTRAETWKRLYYEEIMP
jgi:hypothetical protein